MSIFNRPHYTSEITQFIDELKQKRPHLEADQRTGRAQPGPRVPKEQRQRRVAGQRSGAAALPGRSALEGGARSGTSR